MSDLRFGVDVDLGQVNRFFSDFFHRFRLDSVLGHQFFLRNDRSAAHFFGFDFRRNTATTALCAFFTVATATTRTTFFLCRLLSFNGRCRFDGIRRKVEIGVVLLFDRCSLHFFCDGLGNFRLGQSDLHFRSRQQFRRVFGLHATTVAATRLLCVTCIFLRFFCSRSLSGNFSGLLFFGNAFATGRTTSILFITAAITRRATLATFATSLLFFFRLCFFLLFTEEESKETLQEARLFLSCLFLSSLGCFTLSQAFSLLVEQAIGFVVFRSRSIVQEVTDHRFLTLRRLFISLLHAIRIFLGFRLDFFGALVASNSRIQTFVIPTQTFDVIVRRFQELVRDQHDRQAMTLFDLGDVLTLFIQEEAGDINRHLSVNGTGAFFHGFFFQDSEDLECAAFRVTDHANTVTARARDVVAFSQSRTQALTGQFHQAEAADFGHLNASAVIAQSVLQTLFNSTLVLRIVHVDEVDHDQTAQVTQTHLTSDFVGSFAVGAESRFFDVGATRCTSGVHVNGHQRFGVVDHNRAAGGQRNRTGVSRFDLMFDLEAREQGRFFTVTLDATDHVGHHVSHELTCLIIDFVRVDQDFTDFRLEIVADGTDNEVAFFNDQERSRVSAL